MLVLLRPSLDFLPLSLFELLHLPDVVLVPFSIFRRPLSSELFGLAGETNSPCANLALDVIQVFEQAVEPF